MEENERTNGSQYSNMTFATLDASSLDYPPNSFDVVFFTYLLVYLSDAEMKSIAKKLIRLVLIVQAMIASFIIMCIMYNNSSTMSNWLLVLQWNIIASFACFS